MPQRSDLYLLGQRDGALRNFDLSIEYFNSLDGDDFGTALRHIPYLQTAGVPGGAGWPRRRIHYGPRRVQAVLHRPVVDLLKRIKQHWGARNPFHRLIYGRSMYDSIFPVDELRALDNT
ncbi:hypothetical protein [Paenarthrobacter sp. YIM B13468]|uniref:hypothetical protein n=1 Tax=Paenarthrobacter sp. YIM B13468 TaxID=3366295 RepID=UPI00366AB599